jgi:hypothetical protein
MQQDQHLLHRARGEMRPQKLLPEAIDVIRRERVPALLAPLDALPATPQHHDFVPLHRVQRRLAPEPRQERRFRDIPRVRQGRRLAALLDLDVRQPGPNGVAERGHGSGRPRWRRSAMARRAPCFVEDRSERVLRHLRRQRTGWGMPVGSPPDHRATRRAAPGVLDVRRAEGPRPVDAVSVGPTRQILAPARRTTDLEMAGHARARM